jgi:hypothetical protein
VGLYLYSFFETHYKVVSKNMKRLFFLTKIVDTNGQLCKCACYIRRKKKSRQTITFGRLCIVSGNFIWRFVIMRLGA